MCRAYEGLFNACRPCCRSKQLAESACLKQPHLLYTPDYPAQSICASKQQGTCHVNVACCCISFNTIYLYDYFCRLVSADEGNNRLTTQLQYLTMTKLDSSFKPQTSRESNTPTLQWQTDSYMPGRHSRRTQAPVLIPGLEVMFITIHYLSIRGLAKIIVCRPSEHS